MRQCDKLLAAVAAFLLLAGCNGEPAVQPAEEPKIAFERVAQIEAEHGARLSLVLGCSGCHGKDLAGRDWSDELGVLWTANLTRGAATIGDEELAERISTGERPGRELWGMPSHLFTQLDAGDLASVIAYIRSKPVTGEVHPSPTFSKALLAEIEKGSLSSSRAEVEKYGEAWPPDAGPQHALGRYIVRATCAECHTMQLRGGTPPLPGQPARPDLRIVGSYDPADFTKLMREGKAAGNRELTLMSEVARGRYAHLTDREVEALRAYLVALATIDP